MYIYSGTVTMTSCEVSGNTAAVNMIHKSIYIFLYFI